MRLSAGLFIPCGTINFETMAEPQNTVKTGNKGQFKPGNPGKPPGTQNHLTKTVKETVLAVFTELQTDPKTSLKSFAEKFPRDFYAIAAKLIPTELTGSLKQVITVTDTQDE